MFKKLLSATALLCIGASNLFAGAWTQPQNNFYFKVSMASSKAKKQFTNKGKTATLEQENTPYENRELGFSAYLEYGVTNWLTGVVSLPHKSIESNTKSFIRENKGSGDLTLGARIGFNPLFNLNSPIVTAAQINFKIPTGYDNENVPSIGSGQKDIDLKFMAGTSFYPIPAYFTGDIGFRYRADYPANEIPYYAELGYTFKNRILVRGFIDGVATLGDLDEPFNPAALAAGKPYFPEASSYLKAGPGVIIILKPFLEVNIDYVTMLSGKNTLKTNEVSFGIAYKFSN